MSEQPTLARRALGLRLQRLRDGTRESPAAVGDSIGMSRKTIDRIEKGVQGTKRPVIESLCRHYDVDDKERSYLLALWARSAERGWWEAYFDASSEEVISPDFPLFLESEQIATLIRMFESEVIPGLLQTPEYLLALQAVQLPVPPEVAEKIRALRVHRQKLIFGRKDNPQMEFLIGAGAMHYLMRLPEPVRDGQIARLREVNALPNASVRILTGLHAAAGSPFKLLTTSPDMPPIAYLESRDGCRYIERSEVVFFFERLFTSAQGNSEALEEYLA
ncbi:helix-turn-helix domain-containing protein [Glycomyces buryatensis]|nr:helix-turn-helix transcriptional regulator [Glycomyces buryatensis]